MKKVIIGLLLVAATTFGLFVYKANSQVSNKKSSVVTGTANSSVVPLAPQMKVTCPACKCMFRVGVPQGPRGFGPPKPIGGPPPGVGPNSKGIGRGRGIRRDPRLPKPPPPIWHDNSTDKAPNSK